MVIMKEAIATSYFNIWTTCPECGYPQDRTDYLKDFLDDNELSAEDCDIEIVCEKCPTKFIITAITY